MLISNGKLIIFHPPKKAKTYKNEKSQIRKGLHFGECLDLPFHDYYESDYLI